MSEIEELANKIYHGSPYLFDTFKERTLTGSGANYFGKGTYSSDLLDTAIDYTGYGNPTKRGGYVYDISLPNIDEYLQFNKTLAEQSPFVQSTLKEVGLYNPDKLANNLYWDMVADQMKAGIPKEIATENVSNELRMYGIKGNTFTSNVSGYPVENIQVTYMPEDIVLNERLNYRNQRPVRQYKEPVKFSPTVSNLNPDDLLGPVTMPELIESVPEIKPVPKVKSTKPIVKASPSMSKAASTVLKVSNPILTGLGILEGLTQPVSPGTLPANIKNANMTQWDIDRYNNALKYFRR